MRDILLHSLKVSTATTLGLLGLHGLLLLRGLLRLSGNLGLNSLSIRLTLSSNGATEALLLGAALRIALATPAKTAASCLGRKGTHDVLIEQLIGIVTTKTVLLTAHPRGKAHEVAVPQVAPLLSAIPNLVFFQTIAAMIAERLKSWDVHPYLDAVSKQMEVKAEGYEESVNALKAKAAECYGM